ncbi:hypothetical protein KBW71_00180 [Hydrogenophaga aromaticivorans]|uniref:hypothetical protein n=1 Tax=Hydrogenophaga aromaticivorans TaxID=2610898 RepID=UPI001B3818D0|nr:hypothetical protein [Hydrogenophaga aromaticivorans]MBQ0916866.1 hypothetical protein [Hydrogenophaga aromaticivorans]
MSNLLMGSEPLRAVHFESQVAMAVFNDKGISPRNQLQARVEIKLLDWVANAPPKQLMRYSRQIDLIFVPMISPTAFRRLCSMLCEFLPQSLENMPHAGASVGALSRAVHLSRFIHPDALDRITAALKSEGLA